MNLAGNMLPMRWLRLSNWVRYHFEHLRRWRDLTVF